jgi:hypothetical protein
MLEGQPGNRGKAGRKLWQGPITAALITLAVATTALAAQPKAGKRYAGTTSAPVFNKFMAPVSFSVSSDGRKLRGFVYSDLGCQGSGGGLVPGVNYYLKPFNTHKLGTVTISARGAFSVKNVATKFSIPGNSTTITTSSVSGKFKTAKLATGTITFTQKISTKFNSFKCGPAQRNFTAKLK